MKISILGKIVLFVLCTYFSFGGVKASINKSTFYLGDSVTLLISASGEDIKFPPITSIEGFRVIGTSSSQQISIINGKTNKTQVMEYSFEPTKSLHINPFIIEIDGKQAFTNPVDITMVEPSASKASDPIALVLKTDKKSYYKGEPILTTITFKYKKDAGVIDAKLMEFNPEHFWVKTLNNPKPIEQNGYIIYKLNYILYAKQAGKVNIPNHSIKVAMRSGMSFMKWDKVFSNNLSLNIKDLPQGVNILGDYVIEASVDTTNAKQNDPVNFTIHIKGEGNLEDLNEFQPNMPNQVLYSSKPAIKASLTANKLMSDFTQKISIISDKDYTIPPISFKYFDMKTKSVKTISSKEIAIKVEKSLQKSAPKIETLQSTPQTITQKEIQYIKEDSYVKYVYGVVGFILGALTLFLVMRKNTKQVHHEETPLTKQIKKAKTDKDLYDVLIAYSYDLTIKSYIKKLDENIYNNGKNKIDRRELIEYINEIAEI